MKNQKWTDPFAKVFNKELWKEIWKKVDTKRVLTLLIVILFCLVFLPGVAIYDNISTLREQVAVLSTQIEELTAENQELKVEKEELDAKILVLSNAVSKQAQTEEERQEEEAKLSLPSGFPVTGAVSMNEVTMDEITAKQAEAATAPEGTEVEQLPSDTPIMIFTAVEGNSVIASGSGVVVSIEDDEIYGKVIRIDHGNGYETLYRNAGAAKVEAGDHVTRGTVLFVVGSKNTMIGFQVLLQGQYIDPMNVVDIAG